MNKLAAKVSEAELEVLRVLWDAGAELPLAAIRTALQQRMGWEHSTIKTLLHRLHQKGVVSQRKGDVYYYHPALTEGEYGEYTTQQLIDRLYRGSARELIASLVSSRKLSREDVEDLRRLLREEGDDDA